MVDISVRAKERAILIQAKAIDDKLFQSLNEDRMYGSPASFWRNAQDHGLVSGGDVSIARYAYGKLWHYRGD